MQKQIDKMIASRVLSEYAIVQHERNPGQGVPVLGGKGTERPFNTFRVNTMSNMIVFSDVYVVIEINEIIARYPAEGGAGNNN